MPCPVDTTLQFAKICGSVQEICPVGDPQNLRVTIDLVNPEGGALTDPTTDAFVVGGRIFDDLIQDSTDGCWCTCDLLVNTAADPAMSLQPNNTAYKITVRWGTTAVIDGLQFQLDADTIGNFTLDTNAECGDCINISDLVEIPVLPPAATFCDQVDACVTDLQAQADGNTAAIAALVDENTTNVTAALTADTSGIVATITDSDGNNVASTPIPLVSGDGDQVATVGTDGAVLVSCEAIQDCVGAALAAVDGITYDDAGNAITVNLVDSNGTPITPNADGIYALPAPVDVCAEMSDTHTVAITEGSDPLANATGALTGNGCDGLALAIELPPCAVTACATDPATGSAVIIDLTAGTPAYATADGAAWLGNPATLT